MSKITLEHLRRSAYLYIRQWVRLFWNEAEQRGNNDLVR